MVVLELYFKGAELTEALLPNVILPLHRRLQGGGGGLSRVLLTYKGRPSEKDNPRDAETLRAALPAEVAVSAVWSAKNAYVGSGKNARGPHLNREEATYAKFVEYNREMEAAGASSILVVSGAGGKKTLDSCGTLSRAASSAPPSLPLGVAFNPHIGGVLDPYCGEEQREQEWSRLRQKIRSGAAQVWIAFGADVAALEFGLVRLQQEITDLSTEQPGCQTPRVFGSVFVPCKAWIAKMRFRCWNGTFLGPKDEPGAYLSSIECAQQVTRQTLKLFDRYGVEVVVESSVRTAREVEQVMEMLADDSAAAVEVEAGVQKLPQQQIESLPTHSTCGLPVDQAAVPGGVKESEQKRLRLQETPPAEEPTADA